MTKFIKVQELVLNSIVSEENYVCTHMINVDKIAGISMESDWSDRIWIQFNNHHVVVKMPDKCSNIEDFCKHFGISFQR